MTSFALTAALATPAPSTDGRVLVMRADGSAQLQLRRTIDAELVTALAGLDGIDVVAAEDLRRRLELEGERQQLECDDSSSACIAELKNALGLPWVVYVVADDLDSTAIISLSLAGHNGQVVSRVLVKTPDDGRRLSDDVARGARQLMRPLQHELGTLEPPGISAALVGGAVGVGIGTLALVLGTIPAISHGLARDQLVALRSGDDVDAGLADARALQITQQQAAADWDSWGMYAVVGGSVAVAAGAVAMVVGVVGGDE